MNERKPNETYREWSDRVEKRMRTFKRAQLAMTIIATIACVGIWASVLLK